MRDEEFDRLRERNKDLLETSRHLFEEAKKLARVTKAARDHSHATIEKARTLMGTRTILALAVKPHSAG